MARYDSSSESSQSALLDDATIERPQVDDADPIPPVGITPHRDTGAGSRNWPP